MLVVFDNIIPIVTVWDIPVTVLGIPAHLMRRLQSVLNAAARLIFSLKRSDHITDALVSLHWLRVPKCIQYKIAVLSYKVLHDTEPRYLWPLTRVADIPGWRALRSACTDRLEVPYLISNFPPSAAELFWLPPHRSVTHYQTQSFRHQHCSRSNTNWKLFYFNDSLFISTVIVVSQ